MSEMFGMSEKNLVLKLSAKTLSNSQIAGLFKFLNNKNYLWYDVNFCM